jgi:hypothetical protein
MKLICDFEPAFSVASVALECVCACVCVCVFVALAGLMPHNWRARFAVAGQVQTVQIYYSVNMHRYLLFALF